MALNPILSENEKPGVARSIWDAPASNQIEGFATDISIDQGETVSFKINVNAATGVNVPYHIEIYRLGYYGGDGATLVTTIGGLTGTAQPAPLTDTRGLVDAGNWAVSTSWGAPSDAASGVYLAKLVRDDNGETNQIPFIIREDALRSDGTRSDIVLQTSDTTWQAYNGWGGNNAQIAGNFYGGYQPPDVLPPDAGPFGRDRAYAVSYNRPITTRDGGGFAAGGQDYLFGADYAAIFWLEKNGYDVSYISGVDADRLGPSALLGHAAYISVGHDEYWSGAQRANVEAARDAGVNLLFWGGNDIYWKTRFEPSIDATSTDHRTLVSYKETWANYSLTAQPQDYANIDPSNEWTGTWRDLRFADAVDGQGVPIATGAIPENALTGQLFVGDGNVSDVGLDVPQELSGLRVWRDTSVFGSGATNLAPSIIGYEWNKVPDDEYRPDGLIELSRTVIDWPELLVDQGNRTAPGTDTHSLSLYRAPSGALVFGAGTVFWTWGLSDEHDSSPYGATIANVALQQFTVNLFADMGIQPGISDLVLASQSLTRAVASTDTAPASITLNDIPTEVEAFIPYNLTGTATDNDGNPLTQDGQVAIIEVSFDNGASWAPAVGQETWSYVWTPTEVGTYQVRVRAIDDSLNLPTLAGLPSDTVNVTPPVLPSSFSLFDAAPVLASPVSDGTALELGVRFTAQQAGVVTELHYFRAAADANDTDVRDGHLWDAAGNLLATATFTSPVGQSGWQTVVLASPIIIVPGQTYTASYRTQDFYVATGGFFATDHTDTFEQLTAPAIGNGVFRYGTDLTVPIQTYQAANYWVDLTYEVGVPDNTAPVFTSASSFSVPENSFAAAQLSAQDAQGDPLTFAIAGGLDAAQFNINSQSGALRFLAAPDFEAPADFGADNIYDVTVTVTDNITAPVTAAIQITVTDQASEVPPSQVLSLFDAGNVVSPMSNDATPVELGVRFSADQTGLVTELRYFRPVEDSNDTDVRDGHLWNAAGILLGAAQFTSGPGESGWQTAALGSGILVEAGQSYTVSYKTMDNYVGTQGFFSAAHTDPTGVLTAPAGANGVYAYGAGLVAPSASYAQTNYWVDFGFTPGTPANNAPVITSAQAFSALENQTLAGVVTATDADLNTLTFMIAGGADGSFFSMDPNSGTLVFRAAPNFEAPSDTDANNVYDVTVGVSDGIAPLVTQALQVTVTDEDPETPPPAIATLFDAGDNPATSVLTDPTAYELGVRFLSSAAGDITSLRYFRGAEDSADTDVRVLNLWDAAGAKLASVTVQSDPGASGWQIGTLAAPVPVTANAIYTVSYGTNENYVASNSFFATQHAGTGGILTAPANTNGVFAAGSPGAFPTQSYQATNYWADVGFETAGGQSLSSLGAPVDVLDPPVLADPIELVGQTDVGCPQMFL